MASSNNLDALSQDGEPPFVHPGHNFDDTPEGFEPSPLVDQGPERDYTPDEDGPCWFRQHHRQWRRAHRDRGWRGSSSPVRGGNPVPWRTLLTYWGAVNIM